MKGRIGQSPDLADAAVVLLDMARRLGSGELTSSVGADSDWEKFASQNNDVYVESNLYARD